MQTQYAAKILKRKLEIARLGIHRNARFAKARVNGKKGLIIFPDNYVHPEGVTWPLYINTTGEDGWTSENRNKYTVDEWISIKAAGAVFLPAAGRRTESSIELVGGVGFYWTSMPSFAQAKNIGFTPSGLGVMSSWRRFGLSVRPIR